MPLFGRLPIVMLNKGYQRPRYLPMKKVYKIVWIAIFVSFAGCLFYSAKIGTMNLYREKYIVDNSIHSNTNIFIHGKSPDEKAKEKSSADDVEKDHVNMIKDEDIVDVEDHKHDGDTINDMKNIYDIPTSIFRENWVDDEEIQNEEIIDNNWVEDEEKQNEEFINNAFRDSIENVAVNNSIIVSVADKGFLDTTINFYRTSIEPYGIINYLVICIDEDTEDALNSESVQTFFLGQDIAGKDSAESKYDSDDFKRKAKMKTKIVLGILNMGYSVLVTDTDMVYFHNPLEYLGQDEFDMEIQDDAEAGYNSGFMYVHPTTNSIALFEKAWKMSERIPSVGQQDVLNMALEQAEMGSRIKVRVLPPQLFPCGKEYFIHGQRMFSGDNEDPNIVVMHNNWLVGNAAKIYRLKEHCLWTVDDNDYYSDADRRYLMYENPYPYLNIDDEIDALISALAIGMILDRIVILPKFQCDCKSDPDCLEIKDNPSQACAFGALFSVASFDKTFEYRESTFLLNPKVPNNIKNSISGKIAIQTDYITRQDLNHITHRFMPSNTEHGATAEEIRLWLDPFDDISVLNFHSLYGAFWQYGDERDDHLELMVEDGIKPGYYRQTQEIGRAPAVFV
ncbi:unnamed protein product [Owenia fusiformis]|uniref:Uncharacterized protein n=1 Tax=Owenia fusiformis TaxID=6347 RepID=A0A8J1Y7P3_OWEFU|nr:unnamed protein product [Owenia fusiformis]